MRPRPFSSFSLMVEHLPNRRSQSLQLQALQEKEASPSAVASLAVERDQLRLDLQENVEVVSHHQHPTHEMESFQPSVCLLKTPGFTDD